MKRFLLFSGETYYPEGGWDDFRGSFDDLEDAIAARPKHNDWHHVVDTQTGEIVYRND